MSKAFRPTAALTATPQEIAQWTGGRLIEPEHAPERISGLAPPEDATFTDMAFAATQRHLPAAEASAAGLLLTPEGTALTGRASIEVAGVWAAVRTLMERFYALASPAAGAHPSAVIGEGARLGEGVSIGPLTYIGEGSSIGEGAVIGPHCSLDPGSVVGSGTRLYSNVTFQGIVLVGARCVLHSGVVLGAEGFKFLPEGGEIVKIPQVGRVVVEDDVEIGACTTIDRAFLRETRIGAGTKIDNQVQIAHNVIIGKNCIIAGCSAFAGSAVVEDGCMIGARAGIGDGTIVGHDSLVGGGAGLLPNHTYPPGSVLMGFPAQDRTKHWKMTAHLLRLPRLVARVRKLETELERFRGSDK